MSEKPLSLESLKELTPKQVEVLNLVLLHKTTQEISQELNIARNTVDQRLNAVRDKWGTANRKMTARRYSELLELQEQVELEKKRVFQHTGNSISQDLTQEQPQIEPISKAPEKSFIFNLDHYDAIMGKTGRWALLLAATLILTFTLVSAISIADSVTNILRAK